jgi:hypothetical protein
LEGSYVQMGHACDTMYISELMWSKYWNRGW